MRRLRGMSARIVLSCVNNLRRNVWTKNRETAQVFVTVCLRVCLAVSRL